jgi:arylsulfatase A-like enzyme
MAKPFRGAIDVDIRNSIPDWTPYIEPKAPAGAPNVLFVVWDDTGFGTWDCYGGLVEMPNIKRIADLGLRFTQFHTTALCSPSRAALLTGRNPSSVGMAVIEEYTGGFPNLSGRIPFETALMPEVLSARGWNTYAIGKWHLTPIEEANLAASKRNWPLGRGFERFYGFLGGETDQWYPNLVYDNHPIRQPYPPEEGYHLSKDLADRAIEFIRDAKVIAPDKPWFTYFCPGCAHAPHHVAPEWADRYRGKFDMGYEAYREIVLANQKQMGLVPESTELPPLNPYADARSAVGKPWPIQDTVRPWASLSEAERRLFSRMAEVFAGFQSHADAQLGRVLDYLEESGQLENTIIVVISDNGASGEGGPNGTVNEAKFFNGYVDTVDESLKRLDELGSPKTYNHYCLGWAMAFNTPFKLWKRYASHEGGIADPCIVAWPKGIAARGELRHQYLNVCDIAPTIYDCLEIVPPETLNGHAQRPLEGVSARAAFADPSADTGKTAQFYSMLGTRGIWQDGWFANTVHPAVPSDWGHFDKDVWELFHLDVDRSQIDNLADKHPDKLEALKQLWFTEAGKYNGLPLEDRGIVEISADYRPSLAGERNRYVYYPNAAEVGPGAALELRGRSFALLAEVTIDGPDAEGVIFSHGGRLGGHTLFLKDGRLTYVYNFLGEVEQKLIASHPTPTGKCVLGVRYKQGAKDADGHTPLGDATLYINEEEVATLPHMKTQPATFSGVGEGICVGRDSAEPVCSDYQSPFSFRGGTIKEVIVDITGEPYRDIEREIARAFARD